jgi:tight adherence protein C
MDINFILSWSIAIVAGVVCFLWVVLYMNREEQLSSKLDSIQEGRQQKGLFLKVFGRLVAALGTIISALPIEKGREKLNKKLIQAGSPGNLTADEFQASKIIGFFLGLLSGMFLDSELITSPAFAIMLSVFGVIYPDMWLKGVIEKRKRHIFRDLPDVLDLLRLAVDAGLDLSSAMNVVVERGRKGALIEELEKVEGEMALGRTRKEAFHNFAERLSMSEINTFVIALNQADQLGASIGPLLKVQSAMARTRRWQLAETLVNKMPMKMLGPLVLLIFPSSFIVLFTPLVIQYMQGS